MKILIIDDSSLSRRILMRVLGAENEYVEASEGMRGIELFMLERPDLVFLDIVMPGVSGLEILKQIHQLNPQARIIISTADIQEFSRQQAAELGAAAYLTKPFTEEGVREAVRMAASSGSEN